MNDGLIRCSASKVNLSLIPIQKKLYPLSYKGSFNALGQVRLKKDRTGYEYFGGRIPTKFEGQIIGLGSVEIETKASYLEYEGSQYVNNLIGKIFFSSSRDEFEFYQNSIKLKEIIEDYRKEIKYNAC